MRAAMPKAVYPCHIQGCDYTHRPDELLWWKDGFSCWDCIDFTRSAEDGTTDHCVTLKEVMQHEAKP